MEIRTSQDKHKISMERFYDYLGISRQGVHQRLSVHRTQSEMMQEIDVKVAAYRSGKDRRAGSRSLFYNLGIKEAYGLGVNKFERLMSAYHMSLVPLHVRVITTRSSLQSWNYENLAEGLELSDINQLVVGDLTYLSIGTQRYYLFCLTDVYSARLVGFCLHSRMRSSEAKVALDMWSTLRGKGHLRSSIHHTDGGKQYFSHIYMNELRDLEVRVSVAKNCLENGYAEQRNGFIKYHLLPTIRLTRGGYLTREINRIMHFYNHERKQESLGWKSPVEFEKHVTQLKEKPLRKVYHPE